MTHTLDAQSHCIQMTCRPEAPLVLDIDESRLLSHEATKFPLADVQVPKHCPRLWHGCCVVQPHGEFGLAP